MTFEPKRWLALNAAIAGATLLAACGGEGGDAAEAGEGGEAGAAGIHGELGEGEGGEGEGGEAGHADPGALPIEKRLAFMAGHVEAGLALYRAGEPELAAPHLLHPVSETHASEREGLEALGFDQALFETVSAALEAGEEAGAIEDQLAAAKANLVAMADAAGGDPAEIIAYLMDTTAEDYAVGVTDGEITDAGEYQDAFGFATVARDMAERLDDPVKSAVIAELDVLLALWPGEAPTIVSNPAPVSAVTAQVSRIQLELSGAR